MKKLNETQQGVLKALAAVYYEVVPAELRTFCTMTSDISARTLRHFGIAAQVVPCQLWHVTPRSNTVVGFVRPEPVPGKWDGHAICVAGDWFIDAALFHLHIEFGLSVPALAIGKRFAVKSQAIARIDLNDSEQLWWHKPPLADPTVPLIAPERAALHAEELAQRIREREPA